MCAIVIVRACVRHRQRQRREERREWQQRRQRKRKGGERGVESERERERGVWGVLGGSIEGMVMMYPGNTYSQLAVLILLL